MQLQSCHRTPDLRVCRRLICAAHQHTLFSNTIVALTFLCIATLLVTSVEGHDGVDQHGAQTVKVLGQQPDALFQWRR